MLYSNMIPEVVFMPGATGTQVGNTFYESVPGFVLSPGDYSIISISAAGSLPSGGAGLFSGNSYQNLGNDVNLPGGDRFNSGTGLNVSLTEGSSSGSQSRIMDVVDGPFPVPDGGMTAMFLGASLAGLGWVRRKS